MGHMKHGGLFPLLLNIKSSPNPSFNKGGDFREFFCFHGSPPLEKGDLGGF
jgi:hypothetical protein